MRSFAHLCVALVALACAANAATITLDTSALGSSNDWTSTSIWAGGVVPTSSDDVVIGTCGISSSCSSASSSYSLDLGSAAIAVRSLTVAMSDLTIVGTNKLTVSGGLKWYGGYLNVPTIELSGTSFISLGEGNFLSEYATQTLLGASQLVNTAGSLTITSFNFIMPEDSVLVNYVGATLNLSPTTAGVFNSISANVKYMGSTWADNYVARPAKFPKIDNRGLMNILATSRPSPVDSIFFVADLTSTGSVVVGAGNILTFWRPFANTASPAVDPVATDSWGGSWTFNGPLQVGGGAVQLAADFTSSGSGQLQIGFLEDCAWSTTYTDLIALQLKASSGVTFGNRVWLAGCTELAGANKITFSNQVVASDVIFRVNSEFLSNFTITSRGSSSVDRFVVHSTVTLSGYSVFQRNPSMYDEYIVKLGSAGRIVVPSTAELYVKWVEITWVDSASRGNAAVELNGKATFEKGPYTYDWYVPTTFSASSRTYFTGPATSVWLTNSDVCNFRTTGTVAGFISVKNFYGPVLAHTWTIASTATFEGPPSGGVSWVEFFSSTDVPSSLTLPGNGQNILSLWVHGNEAKVNGPAGGVVNIRNHWISTVSLYRPAGATFVFKNYTTIEWYTITLEGVTFINEGKFNLKGGIQDNANIATRGRVFNAYSGDMTVFADGGTRETVNLINYGTVSFENPQTVGIVSNGTVNLLRGRVILEDTFILLPTSTLTVYVNGADNFSGFQFNGGFWCHVQGTLRVIFDTSTSPWTPAVGQNWALATTGSSHECIGRFSSVVAVGLSSGLGIKTTWSKDTNFYGIQLSICATSDSSCGTSAVQTSTALVYKAGYASRNLPAGIYNPPAGTVIEAAPSAGGSTSPVGSVPSSASSVIVGYLAVATLFVALLLA
eukprot:TRINITY_DN4648_c0_g1_i1.p1 TRINITY_DN4648_c0_g1~~TRINITY_DN4648_c0_g1_i1.p1  ORF type:complete len:893 (+),score=176.20 TRINITY_DN4648_c0_g1_i1:145-2823(+)